MFHRSSLAASQMAFACKNKECARIMISIVDDDESAREATKTLLRSAGYQAATFSSPELFLDSGTLAETECMILDVRMPGMDGLELQRRLNASGARVPNIFITANDEAVIRRKAINAGATDFLCKPFEAKALIAAVEAARSGRQIRQVECMGGNPRDRGADT